MSGDQIVEVERGAARLGLAVALHDGVAEHQQRHGGLEQREPVALGIEGHALLLGAA